MSLNGFNFRHTCLSPSSIQQLTNIWQAIRPGSRAAARRSELLQFIEQNAFGPIRGIYIPIASDPFLRGKFPIHSQQHAPTRFPLEPFPFPYFTNALTIPEGWGSDGFDPDLATSPKGRATNIGFLIVTIEFDGKTTDRLEECLSWTRGGNGEFKNSPFAKVDRELTHFSDYRGYSIVFAGNKSLHFHLLFSTKHLLNAPWDELAEHRLTHPQAAIMNEAYRIYWDKTADVFHSLLQPSLEPDRSLRQVSQWRRAPWALRELDRDSQVLQLPKGTTVPQLVIQENIRSRACRSCDGFLVPPDLNVTQRPKSSSRKSNAPITAEDHQEILAKLIETCRDAWGEFPKPVSVRKEGGQWVIHFRNHVDDKKPSTIVMGDFEKLLMRPGDAFDRDVYLPNGMTADELCESLIGNGENAADIESESRFSSAPLMVRAETDFVGRHLQSLEGSFAKRVNAADDDEAVSTYRERLWQIIDQAFPYNGHMLIRSPEGLGKTSALMEVIAGEIFDAALSREHEEKRFACFAFRSVEQAEKKAAEYRASGKYRKAVLVKSFWSHYGEACRRAGQSPLEQDDFFDYSLNGILSRIKSRQPTVFDALEQQRQRLWRGENGNNVFDSAMTVLFTSHDLARTWHKSQITRAWHDPDVEPFTDQEHDPRKIALSHIIFDEPEIDKILYRMPESVFDWLKRVKRLNKNWKKKNRKERVAIYESERATKQIPGRYSFEQCDEWLRLPLSQLEAVQVDYPAIPFGYDAPGRGMYSSQHGKRFYFGVQGWMKDCNSQITFLTTESLISQVLVRAYEELPIKLNVLDLHADCELFPIDVPLLLDKRAAADWTRKGKANITALAQEKLAMNPNAIVVGNGIEFADKHERVKTFVRVKGLNGLESNDLIIIPTFLAAEEYALLNVTGQWLELPEVITRFYEDQISQAVGRNQGFRKNAQGSVTLICLPRLSRERAFKSCFEEMGRVRIRLAS
jgi:hypothetical protein